MKEIKAVVQPFRLAKIREAVRKIPDFPGMTICKVEGSGYHPGKPSAPGIKGELADYSAKVRLEIISPDDKVDALLAMLHEICHTGQPGDGVVWVSPVEDFIRLRMPRDAGT